MPADLPFDHIEELSAWLAEANIDSLELTGPDGRLFLKRADGARYTPDTGDAPVETTEDEPLERGPTVVTAPLAGILCHAHPMQETPLAAEGSRVRAGQPLALLRIGALLVPVAAPHDGYVGAMLAEEGSLIGYADAVLELFASDNADQEDQHHGN